MPVYVDPLFNCRPFAKPGSVFARVGRSCHMLADSDEELHALAEAIGLKREWHQPSPPSSQSHYDLTPSKREAAIKAGAIPVPRGFRPGNPVAKRPGELF